MRLFILSSLLMCLSGAAKQRGEGFNNVAGVLREVDGGQVIGHAGASYYVPEETMAGYQVSTPDVLNRSCPLRDPIVCGALTNALTPLFPCR